MMKQAFKSYLASLHPRHLKKAYNEGNLFWVLYWLVIYPAILQMTSEDNEYTNVFYLVLIRLIPLLLLGWSNLSSKYLMSKAMFLCPMKEEERKEYINSVLIIKIGVSTLCGIFIELIWSMCYGFDMLRLFVITLTNFSLGIASNISLEALGKIDNKVYSIVKDKTNNTKNHWINNLSMVAGVMVIAALTILDMGAEESLSICCKVFVGVMVIGFIIFDAIIIHNEYEATIALAGDYELSFRILGKVEKPVKFDLFAK